MRHGDWVMRCEARTLDDIRALGGNDAADERRFATAARVSETNLALYRTFAQPFVRAMVGRPAADWLQRMHPLRLQYELFSDANPFLAMLRPMTEQVRKNRQAASADNPFHAWQTAVSRQIVSALDAWRDACELASERMFLSVYGSPALQAAVGIDPTSDKPMRKAPKNPLHRQLIQKKIAELTSRIAAGGLREAMVRSLCYIAMTRGSADERGFEMIRKIRREQDLVPALPLAEFKALMREQFFMLLIDPAAAMKALPALLPDDPAIRQKAFRLLEQVVHARGPLTEEAEDRLRRVAEMFDVKANIRRKPPSRSCHRTRPTFPKPRRASCHDVGTVVPTANPPRHSGQPDCGSIPSTARWIQT